MHERAWEFDGSLATQGPGALNVCMGGKTSSTSMFAEDVVALYRLLTLSGGFQGLLCRIAK